MMWNEEMAGAQKKYPGRLWASAAVPLQDTRAAIEVVDDAVNRLGLMGVNLPGSVGDDARIDAERLEPFYAHVEKLGLPLFLHPTDVIFQDMLDGYDGALHLSLGRVIEVSVAAMRLILSGMMERHPKLKIVMSHTGGSLPYQAGRMDKNSKAAKLPRPVQDYMKRMYTDTVSPHSAGIEFAIDYYGIDHVMYGTDYPCWDPAPCLKLIDEIKLSDADKQKLFYDNARRILNLRDPAPAKASQARAGAGLGCHSRHPSRFATLAPQDDGSYLLPRRKALVDAFPFVVADEFFVILEIHAVVAVGEFAGFHVEQHGLDRLGGVHDGVQPEHGAIEAELAQFLHRQDRRVAAHQRIADLRHVEGFADLLQFLNAARRLDENAVGAGADIALGTAHGLVEIVDRARVGAARIQVSGLMRSDAAALILASASSMGTTFLPTMWPQRFGHCWSSIRMALTPMRS